MYTVYILQSESTSQYYFGYTSRIHDRLAHHNRGSTRSTRHRGPWRIVYQEDFSTKEDAWRREHQIKSYHGGAAFRKLLTGHHVPAGEVA